MMVYSPTTKDPDCLATRDSKEGTLGVVTRHVVVCRLVGGSGGGRSMVDDWRSKCGSSRCRCSRGLSYRSHNDGCSYRCHGGNDGCSYRYHGCNDGSNDRRSNGLSDRSGSGWG